jgi:hypothetical protein
LPVVSLSQVAMQSGLHAAAEIRHRLEGDRTARSFRYRDLGSLAAEVRVRVLRVPERDMSVAPRVELVTDRARAALSAAHG